MISEAELLRSRRQRSLSWLEYRVISSFARLRLRAKALLRAQGFVCEALAGRSHYNICINSDLTVSCNCQDWDGSGVLGNLREQSLEELFGGDAAGALRRSLASGELPVSNCASCSELRMVGRREAQERERSFRVPAALMVENTVVCNLSCTGCFREQLLARRKSRQLSPDDVERVAETLQTHGIHSISYFNLGEPFLSKRILAEIGALRRGNPCLRFETSTNGMLLDSEEKREAALLFSHICFSIDGECTATARKYQVGIDFDVAYSNMAKLVSARNASGRREPFIEWKYVLFRWNDRREQIERAIELARAAGVDRISFVATGFPSHMASWRYRAAGFVRSVGTAAPDGRRVDFGASSSRCLPQQITESGS